MGRKPTFPKCDVFLSLGSVLTLTNSIDPDVMQHYAEFNPGFHCFSNNLLNGFQYTKC